MDNNHDDENVHFKMRLDGESEDAVIQTEVDELRIEKLNHRITFIGILTPVLIVVILSVAYFDIKRRVIRTEDTGAVTVQNLSEDLESRFSTLSLKQAHIEELLAKLQDQTNQSVAKAQINIQKLDDGLKEIRGAMVNQSELKSNSRKIDQGLANLAQSVEKLRARIDPLTQGVQARIGEMEQKVTAQADRSAELRQAVGNLDRDKIDKAAMDLALKLEILKIKQNYNVQLDEIQARLKSVEQKISKVSAAQSSQAPSAPVTRSTQSQTPPPAPGELLEQTLSK